MDQTDLKKGMDGRDALEDEVTALLSALPRVEAPGNFEFGVRSKIAAAGAGKSAWRLAPFAKLAGPLVLLLAITVLGFFYRTTETIDVPPVAEAPVRIERPAAPGPELATGDVPAVTPPGAEQPRSDTRTVVRQTERAPDITNKMEPKSGRGGSQDLPLRGSSPVRGGSVDRTLRNAESILPPGFRSPNPRRGVNANGPTVADVPVTNLLGILGITAEFTESGCKVNSVADNSLAARAGMKGGDVIETIDGRDVKSDTKLKGEGAKNFVVRRDGKRLNLKIGN